MDFVILVLFGIYALIAAFIAHTSLRVTKLPDLCNRVVNSKLMKPEYEPFLRLRDSLSYIPSHLSILLGSIVLGPIRVILVVLLLLLGGLSTLVCDSRRVAAMARFIARSILVIMGLTVKYKGRRALGSEAPCLVANHVCALDMLALAGQGAAFVGKAAAKDMPCIGPVTKSMGCIFVARDSPESRASARKAIATRLSNHWKEKTNDAQLVIFPEGTTTNGRGLLQFRRGAFDAQVPIQPVRIEYSNLECSLALIDSVELVCYISTWMPWEMTIHYLPVVAGGDDTIETCRKAIATEPGAYSSQPLRLFPSGSHRDENELAKIIQ